MVPGPFPVSLGPDLSELLEAHLGAGGGPPVGLGLATVDLDRTAAALVEADPGLRFSPLEDDLALGAHVLAATLPDGLALRLLEPATEGPLAAFLARFGEGPAVLYVAGPGRRIVRRAGRAGPFVVETPVAIETLVPPAVTIAPMPEAEIAFRRARTADAEAIAALFTDEGYPCGPSDVVERLARFDSPYSAVQVAEIGNEVVGFVAIHILPRFEHSDRIGRVLALVVDAGARERGLGHQLMAEAERVAQDAGCAFVEVTAGHHRAEAQSLYESLGYEAGVTSYLRKRL
ncbi:MAG TPA: GNAT family N-acetyltransferase [Candidatus Limnocylindrales bacterium]|nr:GNAT family N-acetyltransferase [Candidatus Limnocylindrales bacterium]